MTRFIDCFKKLIVFFYGSFNYCQEDGRKSLIKYNILIKNIVFEINKNSEELLPLVDIKLVFSCLFEKKIISGSIGPIHFHAPTQPSILYQCVKRRGGLQNQVSHRFSTLCAKQPRLVFQRQPTSISFSMQMTNIYSAEARVCEGYTSL